MWTVLLVPLRHAYFDRDYAAGLFIVKMLLLSMSLLGQREPSQCPTVRKRRNIMNIVVYCGSSTGNDPIFMEKAREFGRWIGENGHTLVFGGASQGLMGAVSDACLLAGGKVIGVLPNVPLIKERKHEKLTECIETESMADRKTKMIELADAFVALPGGIGTLDEVTEVMSLASLEITKCPIVLLDTKGYYAPFKAVIDNVINNGFGQKEYFKTVLVSEDMNEITTFLTKKA